MAEALTPHPDTPCPSVRRLTATAARTPRGLALSYRLEGDLDALAIPAAAPAARTYALWEHTCFEAFVSAGDGYVELNVSPSGEWAAYRLDGYREGMRALDMPPPRISVVRSDGVLELTAEVDLTLDDRAQVALAAVVEMASGAHAYWALRHPPGQPDFHHATGRILMV